MAKTKQIQAHKRDNRKRAKNKYLVTEEEVLSETPDSSTDTNRINNHHVVENRRRPYQGYLEQKEDREREEKQVDNNKVKKRETCQNSQK
eukprot:10457440-Heterocapsa_arctica.AAC.1